MKRLPTQPGLFIVLTILLCGACSPAVMPGVPTESSTPMSVPVTAPIDSILYRGDVGRSGQVHALSIKESPAVQWQQDVGPSVHGAPVIAGNLLLVPTVAARFHALDLSTGEEKWIFPASGDLFSSPAVVADTVYIGNENGTLYALDLATGDELWSLRLDSGLWTAPLVIDERIYVGSQAGMLYAVNRTSHEIDWQYQTDGWVVSPPAWENGVIFISGGASLYALDAETGSLVWQKTAAFWGPHAVRDGVLFAGSSDKFFYALNAETGETIWSFETQDDGWSAPAVSGDTVFFGNRLNQLYALDSKTGTQRWTFEAEDWTTTDPILAGDVIYLGVGNHDNREGPRPLYAIDAQSGNELWKFQTDGRVLTPPAIGEDALYIISFTGTAYALSPDLIRAIQYRNDAGRSGVYDEQAIRNSPSIQWQKTFEEDAYFPVYADDTLYIGTASGKLLAMNPETGDERWSFDASDGPILAIAVADGTIYFGAGDTGFYAVNAETGTLDWSFEADSSVWSSSPLIMDGMAYFGSDQGTVYALDLNTHQVAWTFEAASGVLWHLAGDAERVYVPTQNFVYALDRISGEEQWSAPTQDKWNAPAVSNGIVFVGNGSRQFMALDAETGRERWSFTAPFSQWSEWSAPVVTDDSVFVGYSNNIMYAFDAATGEKQWQFKSEDWATTDPIFVDGILYFGVGAHANLADPADDRLFYALDAATGNELWTFPASGLVYSAATVGNGTIYFKTLDGILYALHE